MADVEGMDALMHLDHESCIMSSVCPGTRKKRCVGLLPCSLQLSTEHLEAASARQGVEHETALIPSYQHQYLWLESTAE